jgi:hypothetical protein
MKGFGFFTNINSLKNLADMSAELPEVTSEELTDEQQSALDSVRVAQLDDDKYEPSTSDKAMGSAGNIAVDQDTEKEAQLGSACSQTDSLGGGFKKEMANMEAFDTTSTTDESPKELAKEQREQNVMEKTEDIFAAMYGKPYEIASKKPDFDLDTTEPNVTIDHKQIGIKKMPKGW